MALSKNDCRALQAFAEHSNLCDDLVTLVAHARQQFVGRSKEKDVPLCNDARILAMVPMPHGCGKLSEVICACTDNVVRMLCVESEEVVRKVPCEGLSAGWCTVNQVNDASGTLALSVQDSIRTMQQSKGFWNVRPVQQLDAPVACSMFLPAASSQLACGTQKGLFIVDLGREDAPVTPAAVQASVTALAPVGGNQLIAASHESAVTIVDLRAPEPKVRIAVDYRVVSMATIPQNDTLVVCTSSDLLLYDMRKSALREDFVPSHSTHDGNRFLAMTPVFTGRKLIATISSGLRGQLFLKTWDPWERWDGWLKRATGGEVIDATHTYRFGETATDSCSVAQACDASGKPPLPASVLTVLNDNRLAASVCSRKRSWLTTFV